MSATGDLSHGSMRSRRVSITFHVAFSLVDNERVATMGFFLGLLVWVLLCGGGFIFDYPDLGMHQRGRYC